ncbi:MAG: hypothetical protein P1P86_15650 [Bacteroidales bacterium]|nr:hypothetical protein [Bacteroidales bacterium]
MKKKLSILSLLGGFAILIMGAVILSSCEGPQGPAGSDGADGTDGVDGVDGQDGQDANATCILCHSDDQTIVTKSRQYANSGHSTGHTSGYTNRSFGPSYNCAGCHTSQGFLDALVGASNVPYADVTQPNCYTCHNIHDSYTEADWALTNPDVTVAFTGSAGIDLGSGNQCVVCHQFVAQYLAVDSLWADFDAGTTTVTINAGLKRAGVHHAPQYNIVAGIDLFEFTGTTDYPTNENHITANAADGCVTCHMNDGFGDLTGHSMAITYEFHGSDNYHWSSSCTSCHSSSGVAEDLDDKIVTLQADMQTLLDDLYDILVFAGVMYPEGGPNEFLMMPGVFTTDLVAAHVNYNAIREDKSLGFHNPAYIEAVLMNTIEALTPPV